MLRQHLHAPELAKMSDLRWREVRTFTLVAGTFLVTTGMLMFALQIIGQTNNEPVWPAPVALQIALQHLL